MAYKIIFRTANGNTTVEVEDLAKTGATCTHCTRNEYPGVCQHCGKLHIRYLAHVQQDIADTLNRATHEDVAEPIQRSDEEIAALGIALLSRKSKKQMDVGCVCVSKYLVDCGVDSGLAERFQFEVNRVTHYLQELAGIDAARTPERIAETLRRASIVRRLGERYKAMRSVRTWEAPKLRGNTAAQASFHAIQNVAYKTFTAAAERFKRESFGLEYYSATDEAGVRNHLDRKERHCNVKLRRYEVGAAYVC